MSHLESLHGNGSAFAFDVDIRDYNLWIQEDMPVILVLFDAARKKSYWLWVQKYFDSQTGPRPKKGAKTVRVRFPKHQTVNRKAVQKIHELKRENQGPILRIIS